MAISSDSIRLIQRKRSIVSRGSRRGVSSWYQARIAELQDELTACIATLRSEDVNMVGRKLRALNAEKALHNEGEGD